jgi:hypothetical protein
MQKLEVDQAGSERRRESSEDPTTEKPSAVSLKIQSFDGRFSILKPKSVPPSQCQIHLTQSEGEVYSFLRQVILVDQDDAIAFDTETTGLTVFGDKSFRAVTLGFCHGNKAISLDLRDKSEKQIRAILFQVKLLLSSRKLQLIAHNLNYDAAVVARYLGCVRKVGWMPYKYCTYSIFRYLSSEGWDGQSHSLKFAMTEMLLWDETNDTEQNEWLINNGYISTADADDVDEESVAKVRAKLLAGKNYKPDKSQMWRVPHEILGKYNALDCFATYQLYREILLPCMHKYTTDFFKWWHSGPMLTTIRNAVDNYQKGIFVDIDILKLYHTKLRKSLSKLQQEFMLNNNKLYWEIATEKFNKFVEEHEPNGKYKKTPAETKEPVKYTKAGYLTCGWKKWYLKRKRSSVPELTANYKKFLGKKRWLKRLIKSGVVADKAIKKEVKGLYPYLFNPNSRDDKIRFLYEGVEYTIVREHNDRRVGRIRLNRNQVELDMTDSGGIPVGKAAIIAVGGSRHIFNRYNRELKKEQFTSNCINKIENSFDGMLHMPYKVPGTNTMRLSGDGGLNLQNLVKDAEFLRAWRPRNLDRDIIYQSDISSLEPNVFTEFSRDDTMLGIYGPGAKPNDIYIYTAALIGGSLGQCFLDEGYDPKNPTKEIIGQCKKKFKTTRNAAKCIQLSDDYRSGAYKKWQSLRILGFDFTLEEITDIQARLDNVFAGKRAFIARLEREWERNKGFILDGFGMPVCVCRSKTRDLANRCIQRSATLILMLWQHLIMPKLEKEIPEYYWMIFNFHDEMIPEIPRSKISVMKRIYEETLTELNEVWLKGMIKIKADPQAATCLAEIKVENYVEEELAELLEDLG